MTGEITLNSPLTKEDWYKIADVELERTKRIWFKTPSGKSVEYIPVSVIDAIKADIERNCCITVGADNEPAMTLHDIFEILDKHTSGGAE